MREHELVAKKREQVHFEKEAPQMKVNEEVERAENFEEPELKVKVNEAQDSECEDGTSVVAAWQSHGVERSGKVSAVVVEATTTHARPAMRLARTT